MTISFEPAAVSRTRVLVVDDEAPHVKALTDVLRSKSYDAIGCESGEQALATLQRQPCELMIADLVMPRVSGIALIREARQLDPDLGCILMTGHGTLESAIDAMRSGAQDYILKPLRLKHLLSVVERAVLSRRQRSSNRDMAQTLSKRTHELAAAQLDVASLAERLSENVRSLSEACVESLQRHGCGVEQQADLDLRLWRTSLGAQQLAMIASDLQQLTQLEQRPLATSMVDMRALVAEAVELQQRMGCTELVPRVGELPAASADRDLVGQALRALLASAYERVRRLPNRSVTVDCSRVRDVWAYFVRDGATAETLHSADLQSAVRRSPEVAGGSGRNDAGEWHWGSNVGLLLAERIVERHGGRLWAEAEGDATTFYFTLNA